MHVVVIGAGIVGTSAAAFLAQAGVRVTVVEQAGLASGASGANSGVVQQPFDPVMASLYHATHALYRDLVTADAGFTLGAEPAGLLYLSRDGDLVASMAEAVRLHFPGLAVDALDGPALVALEPSMAPDLAACRIGIGYPVAPGSAAYAYANLAERRGAVIRVGRSATLAGARPRVAGVIVDGQLVEADAVIVAAGPWAPEVLDPSGAWAPIVRRWGVVVETFLDDGPRHVLEEAEKDAAVGEPDLGAGWSTGDPRRPEAPGEAGVAATDDEPPSFSFVPTPGTSSIGSTLLAIEPDPDSWVEAILERAIQFVPSIIDAPIRGTRCCARPLSIDGRPLVGRVPGRENVYVCAGHGPWGISTGPASAQLVVDLVLGGAPAIDPALDPARFGVPGG
jgi:D-amino-acid dehydrogenase